jgi:hypothetical protein
MSVDGSGIGDERSPPCPGCECVLKLKIVLHCYIVESQRITVLHNLLQAVTFCKPLMVNGLRCYINVIGGSL